MRRAAAVFVVACVSLLVAACEKSPQAAAVVAVTPPDTRKAAYELQERCARDALAWYKQWDDVPGVGGVPVISSYTNHYSSKLGGCFIVVKRTEIATDKATGKDGSSHSITLADVLENHDLGLLDTYPNGSLIACEVNGRACTSVSDWNALLKPYMEE
jgi:hypothetical protein